MPRFTTTDELRTYLNRGGDNDPIQGMEHLTTAAQSELHLAGQGVLAVTPATRFNGSNGYLVRHAGTGFDVTVGEPFTSLDAAHAYADLLIALPGLDWESRGFGGRVCAYPNFWDVIRQARVDMGWHA